MKIYFMNVKSNRLIFTKHLTTAHKKCCVGTAETITLCIDPLFLNYQWIHHQIASIWKKKLYKCSSPALSLAEFSFAWVVLSFVAEFVCDTSSSSQTKKHHWCVFAINLLEYAIEWKVQDALHIWVNCCDFNDSLFLAFNVWMSTENIHMKLYFDFVNRKLFTHGSIHIWSRVNEQMCPHIEWNVVENSIKIKIMKNGQF